MVLAFTDESGSSRVVAGEAGNFEVKCYRPVPPTALTQNVIARYSNEIYWNFGNRREINRGSRILFVFSMNQRKNLQTQLPSEICTLQGYNCYIPIALIDAKRNYIPLDVTKIHTFKR